LGHLGQLDEAIAHFREAIRFQKDFALAHNNLGITLRKKGRLDEAIAEFKEAIRLKHDPKAPFNSDFDLAHAHNNLGITLWKKGQLDEAIAEFKEAIRLKHDPKARFNSDFGLADAHNNLGIALQDKGRLDEAIAEYREALRLEKNCAPARHNLRQAEEMARVADRLPAVLQGKDQPNGAAEAAALASLCGQPYKQLYSAATRFYVEAFAAETQLAVDLNSGHRYSAACAAAQAGCGRGKDADTLNDKERARLRRQALTWLRADLAAWRKLLEKEPGKVRPVVAGKLQHWQKDTNFAGVRGEKALKQLPQAEREAWQKLWTEVQKTLDRARSPAK
jgi:tetratricopeptide (TPR) repeat protein